MIYETINIGKEKDVSDQERWESFKDLFGYKLYAKLKKYNFIPLNEKIKLEIEVEIETFCNNMILELNNKYDAGIPEKRVKETINLIKTYAIKEWFNNFR